MISDSPYQVDGQVMTARAGVFFGVLAAFIMLLLLGILQPLSGLNPISILVRIGGTIVPSWSFSDASSLLAGVGLLVHLLLGALLGLLYAICQQRIPNRGLIVVSIFYGFIIGVVDRLFFIPFLGDYMRTLLRSWSWFLACLLFGLCMSFAAIWMQSRRPTGGIVTPKD
jgi:hypothetical protein